MRRGLIILIAVIAIALIVAGYFVLKSPSASTAVPSAQSNTNSAASANTPVSEGTSFDISISNFAFSPAELRIKAGSTVTWTNKDNTPHTVTSDSGKELDSPTLDTNPVYSHTFDARGTFNYHCSFHPGMKGKIVVE